MILPGSYASGFAPRDGQPLYPELWRGCVGAWAPCLGPSGLTLRDWSGFGNHGTLTNMDAAGDWVPSNRRYALDFDRTNDYVVVAPSSLFDFSLDIPFSLAGWFNNRVATGVQTILNRGENGVTSRDFILYTNFVSGSVFRVEFQNSNGTVFPTIVTGNLALDTWYHVAATKGPSGAAAIWINGIRQVTGTLSTVVSSSNARSVVIGATFDSPTTQYFSGQLLEDIRIYNRVLPDKVIQSLSTRRGIAYELAPRRRSRVQVAASFNRRRRLLLGAQS